MSGTTANGTSETINSTVYFDGTNIFCSGSTASGNLLLTYASGFTTFATGIYMGSVVALSPPGGTGTLTASFTDIEHKYLSFTVPADEVS
jgi:hypothetical protein